MKFLTTIAAMVCWANVSNAQVNFLSQAKPTLAISSGIIADNGIPNAIAGQNRPQLILGYNNGRGFDIYCFEQGGGMPVAVPDAENRASLSIGNDNNLKPTITPEALQKLMDLSNKQRVQVEIVKPAPFSTIKILPYKMYKFKTDKLQIK